MLLIPTPPPSPSQFCERGVTCRKEQGRSPQGSWDESMMDTCPSYIRCRRKERLERCGEPHSLLWVKPALLLFAWMHHSDNIHVHSARPFYHPPSSFQERARIGSRAKRKKKKRKEKSMCSTLSVGTSCRVLVSNIASACTSPPNFAVSLKKGPWRPGSWLPPVFWGLEEAREGSDDNARMPPRLMHNRLVSHRGNGRRRGFQQRAEEGAMVCRRKAAPGFEASRNVGLSEIMHRRRGNEADHRQSHGPSLRTPALLTLRSPTNAHATRSDSTSE